MDSKASSVAPSAAPAKKKFVPNPSAETKLRLVFEELDENNDRKVRREGFRQALKLLNIHFTAATIDDLFERADMSKTGVISYTDYLNFAQNYPTLIEALYS